MSFLKEKDPEIFSLIEKEKQKYNTKINLIASENYPSKAVLEATGSPLTVKYAEGYPKRRYYGGCEIIDQIEEIAQKRACQLFLYPYANVQPHSGSQANMAVLFSVLEPKDRILAMDLACGGHLTHGAEVNFSGRFFECDFYQVNKESFLLDYEEIRKKAREFKPKLIICGASSYSRKIEFDKFKEIADDVGAYLLGDIAHIAGLIAANFHPVPYPFCDFITATTQKTLRGPRGGFILAKEKYSSLIDKWIFPGIQSGPLVHVIAAKAVCFKEAMEDEFKEYIKQVIINAKTLAEELMRYDFNVVTKGTDTHIVLVDLTNKDITGKEAQELLESVGIIVNKNLIPFDKKSPTLTSGIRLGSCCVTTVGMKERDMCIIADLISQTIHKRKYKEELKKIANQVRELTCAFKYY